MMNSEFQEQIGVSAVNLSLTKTKRLVPSITLGDRNPSWDGDVRIYPNDENTKDTLIGKVDVQVKGKICSERTPSITYTTEIADLRNFLNGGGAIYFIVYMDETGENTKIYFKEFLPYNLLKILKECPSNQKTKNIEYSEFPEETLDKIEIFTNFFENKKLQAKLIEVGEIDEESLKQSGVSIKGYKIGFTSLREDQPNPYRYLFRNTCYYYAVTDLGDWPVEQISHIEAVSFPINISVYVGNKCFYSKIEKVFTKDGSEFRFGKCLRSYYNDENNTMEKWQCNFAGSLEEQLLDMEFVLAAYRTKKIRYGDHTLDFIIKDDYQDNLKLLEERAEAFRDAKCVLSSLGILDKFTFPFEDLTDKDIDSLNMLVDGILHEKKVRFPEKDNFMLFVWFNIANLNILMAVKPDQDGQYKVFDFFNDLVDVKLNRDGKEYDCSQYVLLKSNILNKASNINYEIILSDIMSTKISEPFLSQVTKFLLEILKAYDVQKEKNDKLMETAMELALYVKKKGTENIYLLNYLQVIKRRRNLNPYEQKKLLKIMKQPLPLIEKLGAAILLEDFEQAEKYYQQLSETERKDFDGFPINNLWKKRD